ncbi:PQQ-binding-like beta-propeller repeat protein [candidate division KSB1 bacterium]
MRNIVLITALLLTFACGLIAQENLSDYEKNWPQWRGPNNTGTALAGNPPIEWSEQQNIKWKTRIPGTGYSTPAIWGDNIFVTSSVSNEVGSASRMSVTYTKPVKFMVMAVDRATGKINWEHIAREEVPHEGQHSTTNWAAPSPITDGERVYASFGSRGLYCYTIDGKLLWEKDFGNMRIRMQFGEGCSPALYKDRLIVNWDHEGQSFIVALDAATGEEVWRKNRDESTTWMTPLIVEDSGKVHVIISATNSIVSYDISNGEVIWEDEGLTANVIPTPVTADGIIYVTSGYRGSALRAIRLSEAKGNITGTSAILWSYNQDTPYTPSPLLQGGLLYFLKSNRGILTCLDVATGKPHYANQRLDGIKDAYASPAGVGDRVYLLSRDGASIVLQNSSEYKVLAQNSLNDNFDASPVIVGDELYLRGHQYLYRVSK